MRKVLNSVAVRITNMVGTMTCALVFTCLALVSLPGTLATGDPILIVQWTAQTFLQLVLLSVIMVGQNLQATETTRVITETHDASMDELTEIRQIAAAIHELAQAIHAEKGTP